MMAQGTKNKRFFFQKQILDIDQDKNIKRECSKKYKRAPPRLMHYSFEYKMHTHRVITLPISTRAVNMIN